MPQFFKMRISDVFLLGLVFSMLPGVEHRAPNGYLGLESVIPAQETPPLPPGLHCKLEVPSGPVMLGAGWIVHYVVCNHGTDPFQIFYGGDFGALRPLYTWVEAVDPDGHLAADPLTCPEAMCLGGPGWEPMLTPGTEHVFSISARLFVIMDRPGRWTIRVFHDLGYGPPRSDVDPRWATASVDLVMPDSEQAKRVLAEHKSRTSENSDREGKRQEPKTDFAAMAFPIYLPLLSAEVQAGSLTAIEGIAGIPTAEAADELLRIAEGELSPLLAAEPRRESSLENLPLSHFKAVALLALAARLSAIPGQNWQKSLSPVMVATMDRGRIEHLRHLALASTAATEKSLRSVGGRALACCVGPAQREEIILALDRLIKDGDTSTVEDLLLAWRNLPRIELPASNSDGAALVWLDQIGRDRNTRPDGWRDRLTPLLSSSQAYIRKLAIYCIPEQEPDRWAPLLLPLLKDQDESVRLNAVVHAGRCKHMSLLSALRQAMNDRLTNQYAAESITAIAGREAGVLAWIDQLEFGTIEYGANWYMCSAWHAITGEGLTGGWKDGEPSALQRKEQAARLRRFVAAHQEAIARGPIGPPDATWPSDLLPENWYVQLPDHGIWPPSRGEHK